MTQSLPISDTRTIPPALAEALKRLIRRSRGVIILRGSCGVLAAALVSLLAVMALDRVIVTYAQWPRWLMTAGFWFVTALAAGWYLLRPLAKSFTLAGMAWTLEQRHPELQERLSSAVELLTSREQDAFRGSESLIRALAGQATDDVRNVVPRREISLKPAKPFLLAAGTCLLILALLAGAWPQRTWKGLARGLAPWANISKFADDTIIVQPGDTDVAQLQPLRVTARFADSEVEQARLRLEDATGNEQVLPMTLVQRDAKQRPLFAYTCPPSQRGYRYRVHAAGADPTRYYQVRVLPVPAPDRLAMRIELPDYARQEPILLDPAEGDIRALAGSTVTITVDATCGLSAARLILEDTQQVLEPEQDPSTNQDAPNRVVFRLKLQEGTGGSWRLEMTSRQGVSGSAGPFEIQAAADMAPLARILRPGQKNLRIAPDGRLPMLLKAQDAIGIRSARLLLEADGEDLPAFDLPLQEDSPNAQAKPPLLFLKDWTLDLARLDLERTEKLTVRLEVLDTLPERLGGPQRALSKPVTLRIDRDAPALADQVVLAEELVFRQALEEILKQLTEARKDTRQLKKDLGRIDSAVQAGRVDPRKAQLPESALTRIDRARGHLAEAGALARKAVARASEGTFAPLAGELERIHREYIAAAARDAGQIKLSDDSADWSELADRSDYRIYQAIKDIQEMLEQLSEASQKARTARKLEDLARTQEDLADQAGQLPDARGLSEEDAQREDWKRRQGELAGKLAEMIRENPQANKLAREQSESKARDLAREAEDLAQAQQQEAQASKTRAKLEDLEAKAQGASDADDVKRELERVRTKQEEQRLAQLARHQERIAEEAARLAEKIQRELPQDDDLPTDAAVSAHETRRKLEQADPEGAAQRGRQAREQLGRLARRMGNESQSQTGTQEKTPPSKKPAEGSEESPETSARPEESKPDSPAGKKDPGSADDEEDDSGKQSPSKPGQEEPGHEPDQVQVAPEQVVDQAEGVHTEQEAARRKAIGDQARGLSRRQEEVVKQLDDLLGKRDKDLAARRQRELNRQGQELAEAIDAAKREIEDLKIDRQVQRKMDEAARAIAEARKAQDESRERIESGKSDQAAASQQEASQRIAQAAGKLEDAGQALARIVERTRTPAQDEAALPADELVSALDSAETAAATAQEPPARQAASTLSELAQAAAQAAGQAGAKPQGQARSAQNQPGQAAQNQARTAGESTESQTGAGLGDASELVQLRLEQLGLSSDDWARLPGKLRNDMIQASGQRVPAEYRQIVEWYFRAQARQGRNPASDDQAPGR